MKYFIEGGQLPYVRIVLENSEKIISEAGAMSWMSPDIEMQTKGGGFSKVVGRMFTGETMFLNEFIARSGPSEIVFSSSFPGTIIPIMINPDKPFIAQKRSFLCAEASVDLSAHFRKKIGAGLFGGEGFIMQKLSGSGMAFLEIDGTAVEKELKENETLIVSTGYVAGMESSVQMDIKVVSGGAKNILFGGEGLFNTVLKGPGKVYLQSMPASKAIPHRVGPK